MPASSSTPRSICSRAAPAFSPRAASTSPASGFPPRSAAASTTTPASCSSCTIPPLRRRANWWQADAMTGCSRGSAAPAASPRSVSRSGSSGSRRCGSDHERAVRDRGAGQGPAAGERGSFLRARRPRARQAARRPRLSRPDRGTIADLPGVEVAYLSAAEVVDLLAQGAVHLGLTGEDLVREKIPDADQHVVLIDGLGFGHANVVVAVPQAWIDVHSMADLDDVATAFRLRHERKMRLATKYVNLTRAFFSAHGITDYRIVESAGATEGAPAAGTAELIVDITTTGATLAANALKVIEDGVILRSQANLVAART